MTCLSSLNSCSIVNVGLRLEFWAQELSSDVFIAIVRRRENRRPDMTNQTDGISGSQCFSRISNLESVQKLPAGSSKPVANHIRNGALNEHRTNTTSVGRAANFCTVREKLWIPSQIWAVRFLAVQLTRVCRASLLFRGLLHDAILFEVTLVTLFSSQSFGSIPNSREKTWVAEKRATRFEAHFWPFSSFLRSNCFSCGRLTEG